MGAVIDNNECTNAGLDVLSCLWQQQRARAVAWSCRSVPMVIRRLLNSLVSYLARFGCLCTRKFGMAESQSCAANAFMWTKCSAIELIPAIYLVVAQTMVWCVARFSLQCCIQCHLHCPLLGGACCHQWKPDTCTETHAPFHFTFLAHIEFREGQPWGGEGMWRGGGLGSEQLCIYTGIQ